MSTLSWKFDAIRQMASPEAPRIFDRQDLAQWLEKSGLTPPTRTLLRTLQEWEAAHLVIRVSRGIYLNRQAHPLPLPEEAAERMRPGAIVSLGSVLGRAGVLNNPIHWVTAVVPTSANKGPGEIEAESGSVFRFAHIREELLPNVRDDWAADALEPYAAVPTATPEKALVDWLYLASSARGAARWPMPPLHDWDISDLDSDRLDRLAERMGVTEALTQFRDSLELEAPRVTIKQRRMGPR